MYSGHISQMEKIMTQKSFRIVRVSTHGKNQMMFSLLTGLLVMCYLSRREGVTYAGFSTQRSKTAYRQGSQPFRFGNQGSVGS